MKKLGLFVFGLFFKFFAFFAIKFGKIVKKLTPKPEPLTKEQIALSEDKRVYEKCFHNGKLYSQLNQADVDNLTHLEREHFKHMEKSYRLGHGESVGCFARSTPGDRLFNGKKNMKDFALFNRKSHMSSKTAVQLKDQQLEINFSNKQVNLEIQKDAE